MDTRDDYQDLPAGLPRRWWEKQLAVESGDARSGGKI
jgi:hypothetical protein